MQIKTFPHEFLARWGRDGKLQGYHVVPVDILCDDAGVPLKADDGTNKMETFGQATTLERAGLDLADLLGDALPTVIKAKDRLDAELTECKSQLAEETRAREAAEERAKQAEAQLVASEEHFEGLNAEIAGLRAQIQEMQAEATRASVEAQTP